MSFDNTEDSEEEINDFISNYEMTDEDRQYVGFLTELHDSVFEPEDSYEITKGNFSVVYSAWNLAKLKRYPFVNYKEVRKDILDQAGFADDAKKIVYEVMKVVDDLYKDYPKILNRLVVQGNKGEKYTLKLDLQTISEFLEEGEEMDFVKDFMAKMHDPDHIDFDIEPGIVNRESILIRSNQKFVDWLTTHITDKSIESIKIPPFYVILIPADDDEAPNTEYAKAKYKLIFDLILEQLGIIADDHPSINYKTFNDFFTLEFSNAVIDIVKGEILKNEEFENEDDDDFSNGDGFGGDWNSGDDDDDYDEFDQFRNNDDGDLPF